MMVADHHTVIVLSCVHQSLRPGLSVFSRSRSSVLCENKSQQICMDSAVNLWNMYTECTKSCYVGISTSVDGSRQSSIDKIGFGVLSCPFIQVEY
jgi:hypothetical protein